MLRQCLLVISFLLMFRTAISAEQDSTKTFSKEDVSWMAKTMYYEARGQGDKGMLAVGVVVLNRLNSDRYPKTIKKIILQKNQYSWVGKSQKITEQAEWKRSQELAFQLLNSGFKHDRQLDAIRQKRYLFFHHRSLGSYRNSVVINKHVFYGEDT